MRPIPRAGSPEVSLPLRLTPLVGGIHPPGEKALSADAPIVDAGLPERLVLPLAQHLGAAAEPCVEPGTRVRRGETVARGPGVVSADVHASTSGTVVAVEDAPVPHPSGLSAPCVILAPDGDDAAVATRPDPQWRTRERGDLLERVRAAGIAGLGGAGFPTAVKLGARAPIDTLVLNGAECEPYITADDRLLREAAADVIAGVDVLLHLLGATRCLFAVEDNKPEAAAALRAALDDLDAPTREAIALVVIPTAYPSGGERQLIQILTGHEVPAGGLPADLGIVCHNPGTAVAVHRAVAHGEALTARVTTLTGRALARPGNRRVRLGTPFAHLLAEAGVDPDALDRLIMGGPMMGFAVDDPAVPVVKTTNCVLAATRAELPPPPPAQACIRCGLCADACPASLLPQQLHWYAQAKDFDALRSHHLDDCIECGACAWVCPSHIPLVQSYRFAKGEIRAQEAEARRAAIARERFEFRQARVEAEAAERAERRRARAEAARQRTAPGAGAPAATDAAAARLRTLEERLGKTRDQLEAARDAGDTARADRLATKLADLERKVEAARGAGATPTPAATGTPPAAAAEARLRTLRDRREKQRAALAEAEAAGDETRAGKLREKLADLDRKITDAEDTAHAPAADEGAPRAPTTAQRRAQLATLQQRRPALAERLDAAPDEAARARDAARLADLDARIADLEAALAAVDSPSVPATAPSEPAGEAPAAGADRDAAAKARARADQARRALAALEAAGDAAPAKLEAMRASLAKLEAQAAQADDAAARAADGEAR
jgi:electron transport complex protein RnfC